MVSALGTDSVSDSVVALLDAKLSVMAVFGELAWTPCWAAETC